MSTLIAVRHNIEVAHRLFRTEGKCENIHGHSMLVTMYLEGRVDKYGLLESLDFGNVKKTFRGYLDENYDHHVLLSYKDPWASPLAPKGAPDDHYQEMPGLVKFDTDPTTENIAAAIFSKMVLSFPVQKVEVWETSVNMASYERD